MFCFLHVQFLKVDLMEAVKMLLGLSTEPSFHLDMKTRNEKQLRWLETEKKTMFPVS